MGDVDGKNALLWSVHKRGIDCLRFLLTLDVSLTKDTIGKTVLHYAAELVCRLSVYYRRHYRLVYSIRLLLKVKSSKGSNVSVSLRPGLEVANTVISTYTIFRLHC